MAIAALLFIITSCGKEEVAVENTEPLIEIPEDAIAPPSQEVAKIQKDGHEYIFVAIGEEDEKREIVIIENLYGVLANENMEDSGTEEAENPFDVFILLTDDNVMVPSSIAATVDDAVVAASNRAIDASGSFFEILDPNYSAEVAAMEERGCYDVGWTNFFDTYCGGNSIYYSLPQERKYCDRSLRTVLGRDSGDLKCKKVKTWTNSVCGNTFVKVWSSRDRNGGGPLTLLYQKSFPNGIWYLNYYSNSPEYMYVFRTVTYHNTSFRSYTKFSKY